MIYHVRHVSKLDYARPLGLARYNLRLKPVNWPGQRVLDWQLSVTPEPSRIVESWGPYLTRPLRLTIPGGFTRLTITTSFTAEITPAAPPAFDLPLPELRLEALTLPSLGPWSPAAYLFASPGVPLAPEITAWAGPLIAEGTGEGGGVLAAAWALANAIHTEFRFDPAATNSRTAPLTAFRKRHGVCQDFTQVMIGALRSHGIPAAYVSGYLRTTPPPGRPRLTGADAMHAWVAVWCGSDAGWVGIDPTNACLAGENHIAIAMGRDYGDVAPVNGVFIGSSWQRMRVAVDVVPVE
jgi:transglutaminase-like putative cysteine protease